MSKTTIDAMKQVLTLFGKVTGNSVADELILIDVEKLIEEAIAREEAQTYKSALSVEREAQISNAREYADSLRVVMQDQAATTIEDLCDMLAADAQQVRQLKDALEKLRGMTPEGLGIGVFISNALEGL